MFVVAVVLVIVVVVIGVDWLVCLVLLGFRKKYNDRYATCVVWSHTSSW